jgi:hypothetical protein
LGNPSKTLFKPTPDTNSNQPILPNIQMVLGNVILMQLQVCLAFLFFHYCRDISKQSFDVSGEFCYCLPSIFVFIPTFNKQNVLYFRTVFMILGIIGFRIYLKQFKDKNGLWILKNCHRLVLNFKYPICCVLLSQVHQTFELKMGITLETGDVINFVVQNYMNHRRSADSIFKRYDYCH